jgi:hypothetical protein
MKNKKSIYIVVLLLCLIVIFLLSRNILNEAPKLEILVETNTLSKVETQTNKEITSTISTKTNVSVNQITLNVLGKTYNTKLKEGETAYGAMTGIQSNKENNFSFRIKEYPSLGIFVEEINDINGTPGKYWIYYINGKEASIGISKYILKSGDVISWKQE